MATIKIADLTLCMLTVFIIVSGLYGLVDSYFSKYNLLFVCSLADIIAIATVNQNINL